MSKQSIVIAQIQEIAQELAIANLPPLTEDLLLARSGLDSLAIAILVARLEDVLGMDPFTESSEVSFPVTLGDFIRAYENSPRPSNVA